MQNHNYASDPLEWPLLTRGIAYFISKESNAQVIQKWKSSNPMNFQSIPVKGLMFVRGNLPCQTLLHDHLYRVEQNDSCMF